MIIVSACLAGIPCRWDGKRKPNKKVMDLVKAGEAIPVCPEQLGGLTTPRQPSERLNDKILSKDGQDITQQFVLGSQIVLELAREYSCTQAILKSRSPSCGKSMIYDGTFQDKLIIGNGVTAELLMKNGIEVITEEGI
jgi:uncharacterized protein YbbK (DUF523 family)